MERTRDRTPEGTAGPTWKGEFRIDKEADGNYRYTLVDERGALILRGCEGHSSRIACEMSIPAIRRNAPLMVRYVLRGFEGRYSFSLKDAHGTVIGMSEVHPKEWNRRRHLEAVQRIAPLAVLVDLAQGQPVRSAAE